ncbi:MAG: hypothetical protein JXR26_10705 [Balneolaceae bacterium]|nr:hypothetical protein [Balneolaceae bacterium]
MQQFGWNSGVNLNYEYYQDLAWGGLAGTKVFKSLDSEKKNRINNRLSIELTSRKMDGEYTTPKDDQAGC